LSCGILLSSHDISSGKLYSALCQLFDEGRIHAPAGSAGTLQLGRVLAVSCQQLRDPAATGTPAPARQARHGPGIPTSARTGSWRTCLPCTCFSPNRPGEPGPPRTDIRQQGTEDVISYLREQQVSLTCDPAGDALRAVTGDTVQTITEARKLKPRGGNKKYHRTPGAGGSLRPGDSPPCPETGNYGDLLCPSTSCNLRT